MIVFGEIDSIDGNKAKVKVAEHDNAVYDCYMLQPLTGKNKIDFPYAKDDLVCVLLADGRNLIIGAVYNDVDTRDTDAGDDTYVLKAKKIFAKADDKFQFNDGTNEGLVKAIELTQKLNNAETKINELIAICKTMTVALAPSGTYTLGTAFFSAIQNLTTTQKSDIENDKVKH